MIVLAHIDVSPREFRRIQELKESKGQTLKEAIAYFVKKGIEEEEEAISKLDAMAKEYESTGSLRPAC